MRYRELGQLYPDGRSIFQFDMSPNVNNRMQHSRESPKQISHRKLGYKVANVESTPEPRVCAGEASLGAQPTAPTLKTAHSQIPQAQ
jgi:hypothetical protein